MINFLLVDDAEHVVESIAYWGSAVADGNIGFTITAVGNQDSAMSYMNDGVYSGLITDYYLQNGTAGDLIREAMSRRMEVIVYSSQKRLKEHKAMFKKNNIDFRIRVDNESFYIDLASELSKRCRINKIKEIINKDFLIYKENIVSVLASIILSAGITCDTPLFISGPKGNRKTYIAKRIIEMMGYSATITSPTKLGDLSTIKSNRMLVVENYDSMQEFQRQRVCRSLQSGVFTGAIYTCVSTNNIDPRMYSKRLLILRPLCKRKNEIVLIGKRIFGKELSKDFVEYIIKNKLSIDDLKFIKKSESDEYIKIHQELISKHSKKDDTLKEKSKRKADKHNKIKELINKGMRLHDIAKEYNVGYQAVWKIKKEMINELKK